MSIRKDINDLVRNGGGRVSTSKIGMLVGQWLAIKVILGNEAALIANWDSLAIMFTVLIAPDMWKRIILAKYGNNTVTETTQTAAQVETKQTVITGKTQDEPPRTA